MSLIFDQYSERLRRKRMSPHTIAAFATASTRLNRWLQNQGLRAEDVPGPLLEEYFDNLALELQPSSAETHLKFVRAAYNYAAVMGRLRPGHNPTVDLKINPGPDREPTIIPNDCLRTIRDRIIYRRDWVFFHLLAYTGMRRAEIRGLVYDDGREAGSVVRFETQTLRVIGKGGRLRLVPIHPALGEVLAEEDRTPGRYVVTSDGQHGVAVKTIQNMTKRLSCVFTPHDYRRTVATSLRRNGVDESARNRIMGWGPRDVFQRYYDNVADAELHRAILRLYADDPV
jgi:integrase